MSWSCVMSWSLLWGRGQGIRIIPFRKAFGLIMATSSDQNFHFASLNEVILTEQGVKSTNMVNMSKVKVTIMDITLFLLLSLSKNDSDLSLLLRMDTLTLNFCFQNKSLELLIWKLIFIRKYWNYIPILLACSFMNMSGKKTFFQLMISVLCALNIKLPNLISRISHWNVQC